MARAKWIWNPCDFELYHHMLLSNRRTVGSYIPDGSGEISAKTVKSTFHSSMWKTDRPTCALTAVKTAVLENEETVTFHANTEYSVMCVDGRRFCNGDSTVVGKGEHTIKVEAFSDGGFPSVMIEGDVFATDETWRVINQYKKEEVPGTNYLYTEPEDDPTVFKFSYKQIFPVSVEKTNGGTLYDFGEETFAKLTFSNVSPADCDILAVPGESREEALDPVFAVATINPKVRNGNAKCKPVAFRYLFVPDFGGEFDLKAELEYLDLEDKGTFECDNELVNKIWNVSARTLHLNAREGFFDGIKRDRWVWSGDAYQSYIVNYYLMNDNDIVRRTIRMLRGADEMTTHINTIPDYTFWWISSIWEYYFQSGDMDFIASVYTKMKKAVEFFEGRLDKDGLFVPAERDWVFVDWASFDKDKGPMCAEQLLLARAYYCMSFVADALGFADDAKLYLAKGERVKIIVNERYWDEEKCAFVDDWTTGNRNVTRHANIIALLFSLTSEDRKKKITESVIKNKSVPPITTPYFEFFELDAMLRIGEKKFFTDMLESYWGGMIKLGATTIWEQYDPNETGTQHYMMYGNKYGRSLCHAWGASPIYLLGKYALGVSATSVGGKTFQVRPDRLCYGFIKGKVPLESGIVEVEADEKKVSVLADCDGGTLIVNGKEYSIEKNRRLTVLV